MPISDFAMNKIKKKERTVMKIKKRLEKNGVVVENEEAIKRQNIVINAIVNIISQYLGRGLKSREANAIVEFVETL